MKRTITTNQQMCRVSAPIVSFIRELERASLPPNAQIMNCLLSEHKHDVFFPTLQRQQQRLSLDGRSGGGSWFCPGGEERGQI